MIYKHRFTHEQEQTLLASILKTMEFIDEGVFDRKNFNIENIIRFLKQQLDVYILKYTSTPEDRATIEKELERMNKENKIKELHKILGINQVDDSNHMQFGDLTLDEMLEETAKENTK